MHMSVCMLFNSFQFRSDVGMQLLPPMTTEKLTAISKACKTFFKAREGNAIRLRALRERKLFNRMMCVNCYNFAFWEICKHLTALQKLHNTSHISQNAK